MKAVWSLLAIILTCLTIGGLMSVAKDPDTPSLIFDLAISGLLGWGAWGSWKRAGAGRTTPHEEGP
jgi:hypothetical protein